MDWNRTRVTWLRAGDQTPHGVWSKPQPGQVASHLVPQAGILHVRLSFLCGLVDKTCTSSIFNFPTQHLILLSKMLNKVKNRMQILIGRWVPSFTAVFHSSLWVPALISLSFFFSSFYHFLLNQFFKVLKLKLCSICKFVSASYRNSDKANTDSMHSSLAFWSKPCFSFCLFSPCKKGSNNRLKTPYPYFLLLSSSTKLLDSWLWHLQSCSGKFLSVPAHVMVMSTRAITVLSLSQMCWRYITVPPLLCVCHWRPASLCLRSCS